MTVLPVRLMIDTRRPRIQYSWYGNDLAVFFFPTHITRLGELQTGTPSLWLSHEQIATLFDQVRKTPLESKESVVIIEAEKGKDGISWRWQNGVIEFFSTWLASTEADPLPLTTQCTITYEQFLSFKAQYQQNPVTASR